MWMPTSTPSPALSTTTGCLKPNCSRLRSGRGGHRVHRVRLRSHGERPHGATGPAHQSGRFPDAVDVGEEVVDELEADAEVVAVVEERHGVRLRHQRTPVRHLVGGPSGRQFASRSRLGPDLSGKLAGRLRAARDQRSQERLRPARPGACPHRSRSARSSVPRATCSTRPRRTASRSGMSFSVCS